MLRHERNRGVGAAIRSGIDWAAQHRFDVVVVLGGDDQDDPNEIPRLLEPIERGDVEFAQGSRRLGGRRTIDMPLFRRVTTKLYSALFRLATGFPSTDGTNGFRAFRLSLLEDRAIDLHQDWLETYELEPYLFAQAIRRGHRVVEVPVTKRYDRHLGYTKMMPGRDWWRILRPLVFLRLGLRR